MISRDLSPSGRLGETRSIPSDHPAPEPEVPPSSTLLRRFAGRIALTLSLIVLAASGWILFPLVTLAARLRMRWMRQR